MSYSQNNEEQHIIEACRNAEPRRFLDIGSYHPTGNSNTRALYELGWEGIMVEPQPYTQDGRGNMGGMAALTAEYNGDPRITLIQAAVAAEPGLRPFKLDGQTSTLLTTQSNFYVPCVTLEQLFGQFGGGYGFVSIDAEGMSVQLALALLGLTKDIPCVCVECDKEPGSDSPGYVSKDLVIRYTQADYMLVGQTAENAIFRKKTWEESHP